MNALAWLNSPATRGSEVTQVSRSAPEECRTVVCKQDCWLSRWGHFCPFFPLQARTETLLATFHPAFTSRSRKLLLLPEVVLNRPFLGLCGWKMCASFTDWCRRSQPTWVWHHFPNKGKIILMTWKKRAQGFRRDVTSTFKNNLANVFLKRQNKRTGVGLNPPPQGKSSTPMVLHSHSKSKYNVVIKCCWLHLFQSEMSLDKIRIAGAV